MAASAHAQSRAGSPPLTAKAGLPPLVLAEQGSFFVNAETIETRFPSGNGTPAAGHISGKGMYVQYQIPKDRRGTAYPVVMVHGSSHAAKTYEDTPDGRMGWAKSFVRRGVPTYVVDHAGPPGPASIPSDQPGAAGKNAATVPSFTVFTNENAWTTFRIGPTAFTAYPTTKFPVEARDQYFAQLVPNTETSYPDSGAPHHRRPGGAARPHRARRGDRPLPVRRPTAWAWPSSAPRSSRPWSQWSRACAPSRTRIAAVFARVPLLTMFGDFFGTDVGDWPGRMAECVATVDKIKAAKGAAENIHLPSRGVPGNSHMLMMDTNNQQLADMILSWLDRHARAR